MKKAPDQTHPRYTSDLAWIYDAGFSGYALSAAPGILKILRESGVPQGLIVDLGCGSGILARQLSFAGHRVLGIDNSASMVAIARERAPGASFRKASLFDTPFPRCAAVLCIGEVLNFAGGAIKAPPLRKLFSRVWKALLPGGIFVLDFGQDGRLPAGMPLRGSWSGHDWAVLVETEPRTDPLYLERRLTTFRRVGALYRRGEELHRLRLYQTEEIVTELRKVGFETKVMGSIGQLRFTSGHAAALAVKRKVT